MSDYEYDEVEKVPEHMVKEFECPLCYADNPYDDGLKNKEEAVCYYCGCEVQILIGETGKVTIKEL